MSKSKIPVFKNCATKTPFVIDASYYETVASPIQVIKKMIISLSMVLIPMIANEIEVP